MNNLKHVVTGECRLSYVHLLKPAARQPGQDPKFSVTVLVPKTDRATMQRISAAIEAAAQEGASSKWGGRPPVFAKPVYDGDGVRPSDGNPFGSECKGHWVFTASCAADRQPQIVDTQLQAIVNPTEIYSGMFGRVGIDFFAYNAQGKKGVGCGLSNVQKTKDGEPLGSYTSAADDFGGAGYAAAQPGYDPKAFVQVTDDVDPITGLPL